MRPLRGVLCALSLVASACAAEQQSFFGESLLRSAASRFGVDSAVVDKAIAKTKIAPSPYITELTDANWEAVLKTGTDDPDAPALPDETVWAIEVYAHDQTSGLFQEAFVKTAETNSSAAGGKLPAKMRFARCDYMAQTLLPTMWWIWRPPILVLATKQATELRFFKIGHVRPFHEPMAELLLAEDIWTRMKVWDATVSNFAPGGKYQHILRYVSKGWAAWHRATARIPGIVFLLLSGFTMNLVIGWMHGSKKSGPKPAPQKRLTPAEQRAAERAALKARLEKEKALSGDSPSASPSPAASEGKTSAIKKAAGARQRKK